MDIIAWLDGKKTYIGGGAAILIGLGKVGLDYYNGVFSADPWNEYGYWFVIGWSIISGRSAITKIKDY